jgi:hypothetical protein
MSESIKSTDLEIEVETLRRVNAELVTKSSTRKQRITELEASVTELQGKLSEANDSFHEVIVGAPLKAMAESISLAPDIFLEQFAKSHKVEMVKGHLTVLNSDGKPAMNGEKPVTFERQSLIDLLTSEAHPNAKQFKTIVIASRASGASAQPSNRTTKPVKEAKPQFGLR